MPTTTIASLLDAYRYAARAKDVEAFIALYHPELCAFDAWSASTLTGIGAWRGMAEGWFRSLGDATMHISWRSVTSHTAGSIATLSAVVRYAAMASDGTERHALTNRLTWVAVQIDGRWRILHEHTSVPVDLESGAAVAVQP